MEKRRRFINSHVTDNMTQTEHEIYLERQREAYEYCMKNKPSELLCNLYRDSKEDTKSFSDGKSKLHKCKIFFRNIGAGEIEFKVQSPSGNYIHIKSNYLKWEDRYLILHVIADWDEIENNIRADLKTWNLLEPQPELVEFDYELTKEQMKYLHDLLYEERVV